MELNYFDKYQRQFTEKEVLKSLQMPEDHAFGKDIALMLEKTDAIAVPKGVFGVCEIGEYTESSAVIEGIRFDGRNFIQKVEKSPVLMPHVVTCGLELADYAKTLTDMMEQYAMDAIMDMYRKQMTAVVDAAMEEFLPEGAHLAITSPGSLVGWEVWQQRPLFELLGDKVKEMGVTLTESCLMFPVKTVSGFGYAGEKGEADCSTCQRKKCPTRRAKFDMKKFLLLKDM